MLGRPCWAATADLAIRTRIRRYRRADVIVTCDPVLRNRYDADDIKLVVEVLSPSNEGVAWQTKLDEYRSLKGLTYILLVNTKVPAAFLLTQDAGSWTPCNIDGLTAAVELPAMTCRLPMADIYEGVPFEPDA